MAKASYYTVPKNLLTLFVEGRKESGFIKKVDRKALFRDGMTILTRALWKDVPRDEYFVMLNGNYHYFTPYSAEKQNDAEVIKGYVH